MKEEIVKDTYNRLIRKLTSSNWLKKWNINKDILKFIKSTNFINNFYALFENNVFTSKDILILCEEVLNSVEKNRPQDFLKYLYNYTLKKSFPDSVTYKLDPRLNSCCELFTRILSTLYAAEKYLKNNNFYSIYPMDFLIEEEIHKLEFSDEYKKFIKAFKNDEIYLLMKLSDEINGYNTLDHVCGVHYLSLFISRQLKSIDVNIDLGRVSGAAAGHDIGKYGCKETELKRVPRLHYYYTDKWFKKYSINYIRNIAINHSTWDLELENLPIESLILIYCDFRVKNEYIKHKHCMKIFSLEESFYVILDKLENVSEEKVNRYKKVYSKLKDFERYLISLGINTDPSNLEKQTKLNKKNYSLLQGDEVVENMKFLSIKHNLNLMYQLRDEFSLEAILEDARSEKNWRNLREFIRIFEEYSNYLTQKQKLQTIKFVFENLTHPEDDIRRHCAELLGTLIAIFDEDYRKELPDNVIIETSYTNSIDLWTNYLELLIYPGHKYIPLHKFYFNYSLSIMVDSLFKNCRDNMVDEHIIIFLSYYDEDFSKNTETKTSLIEAIKYIPFKNIINLNKEDKLISFLLEAFKKKNTLRLASLEALLHLITNESLHKSTLCKLKEFFTRINSKGKIPGENLLLYKLATTLHIKEACQIYKKYCDDNKLDTSAIYLSNLKTNINWITKRNHIDFLLDYTLEEPRTRGLHTVIHFCNLMKVSAVESVRSRAGLAILDIIPYLNFEERNEVAIELLRALEIEGNKFTEYIPYFAAQVLLWLKPNELNEVLDDLKIKVKTSNTNLKALVLKTIGVILSNYPKYKERFLEDHSEYTTRLIKLLGILLNGLGSYIPEVKRAAFTVIGKDLFGTKLLSLQDKVIIFKLLSKKALTLITEINNEELLFLSNSAGLNHIYRFISEFNLYNKIEIPIPKKIAFFPGTFDPFSLSHKEIARFIRDAGYEVYLAVDEFSWSKRTLPSLLRKNILNMSISDELNIYIYPDSSTINISNPVDLKALKDNFTNSSVYITMGSDVILNASAYKNQISENSIHNFNHIIFDRSKHKQIEQGLSNIKGHVAHVSLPSKFSDISSTQIRSYIDDNKDISSLVDPMAQQYIYENGFYQKEAQDKTIAKTSVLTTQVVEDIKQSLIDLLCSMFYPKNNELNQLLNEFKNKPSARILLLKNSITDEILGFSFFNWIPSKELYSEIRDVKASEYIRQISIGRILFINGIYISNNEKFKNFLQIILTETLALSVSKDYEYAIFKDTYSDCSNPYIYELIRLYGFNKIPSEKYNIYSVNISNPCILNLDLENYIKNPFRGNIKIKHKIISTRKKLMEALVELYPGNLVLPFDINFLNEAMIKKVCNENEVPTKSVSPKVLGPYMCIPYGDILDRYIIPNTVTKALHTEKYFYPDMSGFSIREFPHYLNLNTQVRMLKSFNKSIILVDTLLHKGYRLKSLDPILKKEGIEVKKIICGILSGRGKDLMDYQNRDVDSVYYIPRLNLWFNESSLYPFIGGDAIWRGAFPERNLLPSINLTLPYTAPAFIRNSNKNSIYNLSKVCLENSLEIFSCLEAEFHNMYEKSLNLSLLGKAFTVPRCPDKGKGIEYDLSLNPTFYLKNDLEKLIRLENIIKV